MQREAGVPAVATQVVQGIVILLSAGSRSGAARVRSRAPAPRPAEWRRCSRPPLRLAAPLLLAALGELVVERAGVSTSASRA